MFAERRLLWIVLTVVGLAGWRCVAGEEHSDEIIGCLVVNTGVWVSHTHAAQISSI